MGRLSDFSAQDRQSLGLPTIADLSALPAETRSTPNPPVQLAHQEIAGSLGECQEAVPRDARQARVRSWVLETFGPASDQPYERVLRVLEEALEPAQSVGLPRGLAARLADHVFSRPAGEPAKEAGQLGVTLLAFCGASGFSADELEALEAHRVLSINPDYFRQRAAAKASVGLAASIGAA
jgi:hypothetical protein